MRDDRVRSSLEQLLVPPEQPTFFDRFWQRTEVADRRAARRWRRTSIALAALLVTAGTAAGVLAVGNAGGATLVDRTISCRAVTDLDSATLELGAQIRLPPRYAGGGVVAQPGSIYAGFPQRTWAAAARDVFANGQTFTSGYYYDGSNCKDVRAIPLVRSGLPSLGTFSKAGNSEFSESCDVARDSLVTVRLRVSLSRGTPTAARLAIRAGLRQRPVAYVDWTPTVIRAWVAPGCMAR